MDARPTLTTASHDYGGVLVHDFGGAAGNSDLLPSRTGEDRTCLAHSVKQLGHGVYVQFTGVAKAKVTGELAEKFVRTFETDRMDWMDGTW